MEAQTLIVLLVVAVAGFYVVRSFLPRKDKAAGCQTCPQNRERRDDYA